MIRSFCSVLIDTLVSECMEILGIDDRYESISQDAAKGAYPSTKRKIHPRVLKELATKLGPVFVKLFQQSIDTGEIHKEWSLANICPLFKKGDRSLAFNYRPFFFLLVYLASYSNT